MRIFGAGMAGLVAANILRRYQPVVFEAQDKLPDNHGALLRFRSDRVAQAVGQRFKEVQVRKAIVWNGELHTDADPKMANLYSYKVNGKVEARSIWDLAPVTRWIAPPDFLEVMARDVRIELGFGVCEHDLQYAPNRGSPLPGTGPDISTIPMPRMMELSGWADVPEFPFKMVSTMTAVLPEWVDVYQTLYYPSLEIPWYRASLTGRVLTVEGVTPGNPWSVPAPHMILQVLHDFGIREVDVLSLPIAARSQAFGKLSPIPEEIRRAFILWLTNGFGIYSVGRFATWRQILLDDVVQDVALVESMIGRDAYARSLLATKQN